MPPASKLSDFETMKREVKQEPPSYPLHYVRSSLLLDRQLEIIEMGSIISASDDLDFRLAYSIFSQLLVARCVLNKYLNGK